MGSYVAYVGTCLTDVSKHHFGSIFKSQTILNYLTLEDKRGTAVAQWLKCCATSRKVAGSIPYGVTEIVHRHNPSDRTMALGSTQPLTEVSTRNISWGKGGRRVRLTTLPPSCAVVMLSGNLNFLEHSGPLQPCNGTALPLKMKLFRNVSKQIQT